jgi:citrate synthase
MSDKNPEALVQSAADWWTTEIIDIHPGEIQVRGYAIQDLIGQVSFPEMIWLMVRGDLPSPGQARLLEAALVASVDHGPHAPSIAIAQMAATCGIGLNNAMASAINVLGDVHGGAGQDCMVLYELVRNELKQGGELPTATDRVLAQFISDHGKIVPGFGHRFHPVDPRAAPLLGLVEAAAAEGTVAGDYVAIGREVEAALGRRTGKSLPMNIDGATAVIFAELGFAPEMGRGLFILSRSVGILAHAWEQMKAGRRMKGPMPKDIPFTYAGPGKRKLDRPD